MNKRMHMIWRFSKPYKWSFLNCFICIFMTSILSCFYSYVFKLLVDEVFYNKNLKNFFIIILGYLILYVTEQLFHLILNVLWPYQFTVFLTDVRKAIYMKIMSMPYKYFSNTPVGEMMTTINHDSEGFVELIHRNIEYLLANILRIIITVVIVAIMSWKLAVLMAVVVPFSYLVSYQIGKKTGQKQKIVRQEYGGLIGWMFEMLSGMRDIRLLGAQSKISKECIRKNISVARKQLEVNKTEIYSERICALINLLSDLVLYVFAASLIISGELTLGEFIAVIAYFSSAGSLLKSLNSYLGKTLKNFVFIDKIIAILEMEEEDTNKNTVPLSITDGNISFEKITFSYAEKDKSVFLDMSLDIQAGSKVAIAGRSGVGKTTIANMLLGFLHPDKGTIKIDGADLSACSTVSIREAIGIVHQESFTFDGTIRMNLALARSDASEQEMLEACENALLGDYIRSQEKGLDTVIGKNGVAMSGGEKQRLSIARLFLRNPKILIMDEATSALDHQAEHAINQAWKRLADGRTCIIIAHRLSTVLNADKVVVLSEGRVVDYDTHENLYRNSDIYKRLFRDQYRQGGAAFESI